MANLTIAANKFRRLKERKKKLGKELRKLKDEELPEAEEDLISALKADGMRGIRTGGRTLEVTEKSKLELREESDRTKVELAGSDRYDCLQLCYPRLTSLVKKGRSHEEPLTEQLLLLFRLHREETISDHKTRSGEDYKEVEEWTSGSRDESEPRIAAKETMKGLFDE